MQFKKLKWKEIEKEIKKNNIVILPVGSLEQHGYHLPVDTDMDCAWYVSKKVSEKTGTLLLPPVYYSYVEYALDFPGTVSVSAVTFINYIVEITTGLWKTGFKKMLLINGHGGNGGPVLTASHIISEKTDMLFAVLNYYSMIADIYEKERKTDTGGNGHASELETDIKYFIDPDNVDPSKANSHIGGPTSKFNYWDLGRPAPVTMLVKWKNYGESGIYGDATHSTAKRGEKWVNDSINRIVEFVEIFKKMELPES